MNDIQSTRDALALNYDAARTLEHDSVTFNAKCRAWTHAAYDQLADYCNDLDDIQRALLPRTIGKVSS